MARALFNGIGASQSDNSDCQINLNNVNAQTAAQRKTIFVGIAGGTASGKTTVADEIFERVRVGQFQQCTLIPVDCFYKECTPEQMANIGKVNFDHPSMFDWDLIKETLEQLRRGEDVTIPDYNYVTCKRNVPGLQRKWSPLVIFEGIFGLYDKEINEMFDLKIFVHTDDDIRLARRLQRDIVERGRTVDGVLKSYHRYVKPAFSEFVKPTMKYADIIVPRGRPEIRTEQNRIAVDFIVHNLEHHLVKAGYEIVIPEHQLIQLCHSEEYETAQQILSAQQAVKTSLKVVASEDDEQWRSVLATLYEHGTAMGKILVKHMCETLLEHLQQVCGVQVSREWDFPQMRDQGVNATTMDLKYQCLFGLQMLSSGDRSVKEALDLISSSLMANLVIVSVFMSHTTIEQMCEAFASNPNSVEGQRSLTFICLYFGTQPALSEPAELEQIQMKKQRSHMIASPPSKSKSTKAEHGLSHQLVLETFLTLPSLKNLH